MWEITVKRESLLVGANVGGSEKLPKKSDNPRCYKLFCNQSGRDGDNAAPFLDRKYVRPHQFKHMISTETPLSHQKNPGKMFSKLSASKLYIFGDGVAGDVTRHFKGFYKSIHFGKQLTFFVLFQDCGDKHTRFYLLPPKSQTPKFYQKILILGIFSIVSQHLKPIEFRIIVKNEIFQKLM